MIVAALTGNYGMGKSSVASLFRSCGAVTLDSDEIVAGLLRGKVVIEKIGTLLGPEALNNDRSLNKSVVADIIFHSSKARKKLEALLHPLVFKEVEIALRKVTPPNCLVIVEVPLLFEGGFQKKFDKTIAVYTNQKTSLARLRKKGISRSDALARLRVQMDIRTKKRLADYVINNNGTKQQTMVQVRKVFKSLIESQKQ